MPKRKRSDHENAEHAFEESQKELFRALKVAKGFERQRLAKRSHDEKLGQEKLQRIGREILVLKSLDLNQTAQAHLCSAVLKVKGVAALPNLPEKIKNGVKKPEISEEERMALHNVTSALYKRKQVGEVMARAIPRMCRALGVPPPAAKGAPKGEPGDEDPPTKKAKKNPTADDQVKLKTKKDEKPTKSKAKPEPELDDYSDEEELDEDVIAKMEAMLGGSSSEGEDDDQDDDLRANGKSAPRTTADDISLPGTDSEPEEELEGSSEVDIPDNEDDDEEATSDSDSDQAEDDEDEDESEASPEPIARPPAKKAKKSEKAGAAVDPKGSTFLPMMMSGYVSGSESASDVDVAPKLRKNRKGQKERQAIAERKYGEKAKHLANQKEGGGGSKKRDAGWDAKRGAVDGAKPWKRGVRDPLSKNGGDKAGNDRQGQEGNGKPEKAKKKTRDDTGPLHPSWEARKKAKEAQTNVSFQGKKITFD